MARESQPDFGDLGLTRNQDAEVRAMLAAFDEQQRRLDFAKVQHAAREVGVTRILRDAEGLGAHVKMRIPPWLYHKLGQYYGYACWQDGDFCKQVMKHYPECRVQVKSDAPKILVPDHQLAPANNETKKRFSKTY